MFQIASPTRTRPRGGVWHGLTTGRVLVLPHTPHVARPASAARPLVWLSDSRCAPLGVRGDPCSARGVCIKGGSSAVWCGGGLLLCAAVRLAPWTRRSTRPGSTRCGRRSTRVGCHVWLPPAPPSPVTSTCRLSTRIVLAPPAPRPPCPLPSRRALAWCVGCCLAVLGPYTRPVSCTVVLLCAVFHCNPPATCCCCA